MTVVPLPLIDVEFHRSAMISIETSIPLNLAALNFVLNFVLNILCHHS